MLDATVGRTVHADGHLAVFPTTLQAPCTADSVDAATCMSGFSVQGNFEAARRNYTNLWRQVELALASGAVPPQPPARPFHLHLVGRGNVSTLSMPESVSNYTTVHFNLRFPGYYNQVRARPSRKALLCL